MSQFSPLGRKEEQRATEARRLLNLTQVIWVLLEILQRPVWKVFLPPVLPSVQCCVIGLYHMLQNAVHCVIHKVAGCEWEMRGTVVFSSATKILAIFGDCDKVIYYSLLTEKEEKCERTILSKKKVEIMCQWKYISNQLPYITMETGYHMYSAFSQQIMEKKTIKYKPIFPWRCFNTWAPIHDLHAGFS